MYKPQNYTLILHRYVNSKHSKQIKELNVSDIFAWNSSRPKKKKKPLKIIIIDFIEQDIHA